MVATFSSTVVAMQTWAEQIRIRGTSPRQG